ncbi:MAG: geranylgeranylglycerol-phosphate geranylgeranyltransferase [Prevotellaceae bacterium]|jgi:4-hydroxybenzoate polyprenyltransferase|nr:geranylgeranylglycerol-phosphate geranylgeranyltransferase [Prevotellaceae bacterium]
MQAYLKVVRPLNLFFIAVTQLLLQYTVVVPILKTYGFDTEVNTLRLFLLIAATVLIAAGGYALNDYFDIKIDRINRPDKQIAGKIIQRSALMIYHQALTATGVLCGLLLACFTGSFTLTFIFIVTPGMLWFYSASYKRRFLIGNLIVSFNTALSVLIVGIAQISALYGLYGDLLYQTPIPKTIYAWTGGFSFFAFMTTWIREIIKDMEDKKGDMEMECRTMAIVWGDGKTKKMLYFLITLTVVLLLLADFLWIDFEGNLTTRYIIFGIALPFTALIYLVHQSRHSQSYHQASVLSKVIMLIGTLYGFIFYYLQAKTYGFDLFNLFIIR